LVVRAGAVALDEGAGFAVLASAGGVVPVLGGGGGCSKLAGALPGSVSPPELIHAFQPPTRARDLKPLLWSRSAARALVASLGQAQ
jgi:hypothetical protein